MTERDEDNVVDLNTEVLKQIKGELVKLNGRVDRGFTAVSERLAHVDEHLGHMDERLGHMDERLGHMDERLGHVAHGLDRLNVRVDALEDATIQGFTGVRAAIDKTNERIDETNRHLTRLIVATDHRFRAVEGRPRRPRRDR